MRVTLPGFGVIERTRVIAEDELFWAFYDAYPVSPGHVLITPKRAVVRLTELTSQELAAVALQIRQCTAHLENSLKPAPDGFNIGINDGPTAGQTIAQFHVHVIPRYVGDIKDPRGGIRWVLPSRARYWTSRGAL